MVGSTHYNPKARMRGGTARPQAPSGRQRRSRLHERPEFPSAQDDRAVCRCEHRRPYGTGTILEELASHPGKRISRWLTHVWLGSESLVARARLKIGSTHQQQHRSGTELNTVQRAAARSMSSPVRQRKP
jgi:hypothetical protein